MRYHHRVREISAYLTADHVRLRSLLRNGDFERFRAALLRHIGLEEKILLPALRQAGPEPTELIKLLHADHGVLATLLVPTPTAEITAAIVDLLDAHDRLEEDAGGLYEQCDQRLAADAARVSARMRETAEPPLAPHFDGPRAREKVAEALAYVRTRTPTPARRG